MDYFKPRHLSGDSFEYFGVRGNRNFRGPESYFALWPIGSRVCEQIDSSAIYQFENSAVYRSAHFPSSRPLKCVNMGNVLGDVWDISFRWQLRLRRRLRYVVGGGKPYGDKFSERMDFLKTTPCRVATTFSHGINLLIPVPGIPKSLIII